LTKRIVFCHKMLTQLQSLELDGPNTSFLRFFLDWTIRSPWTWQVYALTLLEFFLILELFVMRDLLESLKTAGHLLLLPKFFYYVFLLESFTFLSELLNQLANLAPKSTVWILKVLLKLGWPVANILVPFGLFMYANHWSDVLGLSLISFTSLYKYLRYIQQSFLRELGYEKRNN
jgi:hypothetical protein